MLCIFSMLIITDHYILTLNIHNSMRGCVICSQVLQHIMQYNEILCTSNIYYVKGGGRGGDVQPAVACNFFGTRLKWADMLRYMYSSGRRL